MTGQRNLLPALCGTATARTARLAAERHVDEVMHWLDLARVADDELLRGVALFGARNGQDPLAGFPATDRDELTRLELHELFRQATVLEALPQMVTDTKADELMITTMVYDHAARRRSYELLAEAFGLVPGGLAAQAAGISNRQH